MGFVFVFCVFFSKKSCWNSGTIQLQNQRIHLEFYVQNIKLFLRFFHFQNIGFIEEYLLHSLYRRGLPNCRKKKFHFQWYKLIHKLVIIFSSRKQCKAFQNNCMRTSLFKMESFASMASLKTMQKLHFLKLLGI